MKTARVWTALLTAVVVCVFAAPAQAALTRAQQAARAAGQATFQCFAHDCSGRRLLGASGPYSGLMHYRFRYYGMHGVGGRYYSHCDQLIMVSSRGTISQYRFYNCG